MKQLIFHIKIPKEKFSDLKMIYRSLKLSANLKENEIEFSILEDLKNRRSKVIVAEWNNRMKLYDVWNRNVFDAIVKSIEALAHEYHYEIRTVERSAEMRTNSEPAVAGM